MIRKEMACFDGTATPYLTAGDGPPLVLLHALPRALSTGAG